MEKIKRLPKNVRKYIRKEKTRIRREFLTYKEQGKQIKEIYKNLAIEQKKEYSKDNEDKIKKRKRNISKSNNGKNEAGKSS